jgi:hypothetical protein
MGVGRTWKEGRGRTSNTQCESGFRKSWLVAQRMMISGQTLGTTALLAAVSEVTFEAAASLRRRRNSPITLGRSGS